MMKAAIGRANETVAEAGDDDRVNERMISEFKASQAIVETQPKPKKTWTVRQAEVVKEKKKMMRKRMAYFAEVNYARCARRGIRIAHPDPEVEALRAKRQAMQMGRTITPGNSEFWSRRGT